MQKVKFSDCVEYMIKGPFGSDMKKSLYVPKGDNTYKVYIQINAIQKDQSLGDYYVSEEYFHKKLERFEVHPGDYLITCDGTLGKFIKLDRNIEKGVISSSLLLLKLKEDVIYDKYFELIWEFSMLGYLASQARNACLVHLPSAKAIGDVEILLPDLKEQIDLADRAFSVSDIVEKRKAELALFDELIKARFVELFGDENNSMGWDTVNIEDVADVQVGVVIKPAQYYTDESDGIKAFRSLNIGAGYIKDNDWVYFSPEGHKKNSKSILKEDDLLIVRSGAPGTACVVPKEYEGCNAIDIIIAHPDTKKVNPHYLCAFTNMPHGKKQIEEGTGGAAQQHFNVGKYNKMKLMLPPTDKQLEYVDFVKQVDKSKVVVQKALDETQTLFDSLMQEYFG